MVLFYLTVSHLAVYKPALAEKKTLRNETVKDEGWVPVKPV